jgi:hypothetical protein
VHCRLQEIGGERVALDFKPLCDVALLLYGSALVSERYAGVSRFLEGDSIAGAVRHRNGLKDITEDERVLPVTRKILNGAGVVYVPCSRFLSCRLDVPTEGRAQQRVLSRM